MHEKSHLCKVNFSHSSIFLADAKIKCTFERLEKCFFGNVKEGDQFEWGPGFVSSFLVQIIMFYRFYFFAKLEQHVRTFVLNVFAGKGYANLTWVFGHKGIVIIQHLLHVPSVFPVSHLPLLFMASKDNVCLS